MKHDFTYQEDDIVKVAEKFNGIGLIAWDMGLGKTKFAIKLRKDHGPFKRPVVVIAKASLKWNWKKECIKWGMKRVMILESETPFNSLPSKRMRKTPIVYIINSDIIQYWLDWLIALKPGMLVVDEGHEFRNRASIRAKALMKLSREIPSRIIMTGTPLVNSPQDLWVSLNILWPKDFKSYNKFTSRYCKMRKTPWGYKPNGVKNLDKLHLLLKRKGMIRRKKEDTLKGLPKKNIHIIPIELNQSKWKKYCKMTGNYYRWVHGASKYMPKSASAIKMKSKQMVMKRKTAMLRKSDIIKWIDKFLAKNPKKKLIVFGIHHKMLVPLHERYRDKSVLVNGKVKGIEKDRLFNKFCKSKQCRLLFGNILAAGVGWNGVESQDVLFCEMGWTSVEHNQAMDRVHRIGQKHDVNIYFMMAKNTIEHMLFKITETKQGYADAAIDGNMSVNSLPIHKRLNEMILSQERMIQNAKNKNRRNVSKRRL